MDKGTQPKSASHAPAGVRLKVAAACLALLGVTSTGLYVHAVVTDHAPTAFPPARKATKVMYADGGLFQCFESINGVLDGMWEQYWPDGRLAVCGHYNDGKRHGCWLYMDSDGVAQVALQYRDGKVAFTLSEAAFKSMEAGDGK